MRLTGIARGQTVTSVLDVRLAFLLYGIPEKLNQNSQLG